MDTQDHIENGDNSRPISNTGHFIGVASNLLPTSGMAAEHGGFNLMLSGDRIIIMLDDGSAMPGEESGALNVTVEGFGAFLAKAKRIRVGWGMFPDGMECIYVYDPDNGGWGYAINLTVSYFSEWGYAPFDNVSPAREDANSYEG